MDCSYAEEDEEFRHELRGWLDADLPGFLEQGEELDVDILGHLGLLAKGAPGSVDGGHPAHDNPWQRHASIGAGATEVQKDIIADKAIGLPRR